MSADAKIAAFERDVLGPALAEIRAAQSLAKNYEIEAVTKSHVLNHVLNSVSFYEMYAFGDTPFPGYRTR